MSVAEKTGFDITKLIQRHICGTVKSVKGSGNSTTLLLEKSRKIKFLHLFFIEEHPKLLPFLLMLVDQVKS